MARLPGGAARGPVRAPKRRGRTLASLVDPGVRCLASLRHLLESGVTYEETVGGQKVWVARLVCDRCGTVRVTMYEPHAGWVQLSAHKYYRPDEYRNLTESMSSSDARRAVLNALWS